MNTQSMNTQTAPTVKMTISHTLAAILGLDGVVNSTPVGLLAQTFQSTPPRNIGKTVVSVVDLPLDEAQTLNNMIENRITDASTDEYPKLIKAKDTLTTLLAEIPTDALTDIKPTAKTPTKKETKTMSTTLEPPVQIAPPIKTTINETVTETFLVDAQDAQSALAAVDAATAPTDAALLADAVQDAVQTVAPATPSAEVPATTTEVPATTTEVPATPVIDTAKMIDTAKVYRRGVDCEVSGIHFWTEATKDDKGPFRSAIAEAFMDGTLTPAEAARKLVVQMSAGRIRTSLKVTRAAIAKFLGDSHAAGTVLPFPLGKVVAPETPVDAPVDAPVAQATATAEVPASSAPPAEVPATTTEVPATPVTEVPATTGPLTADETVAITQAAEIAQAVEQPAEVPATTTDDAPEVPVELETVIDPTAPDAFDADDN